MQTELYRYLLYEDAAIKSCSYGDYLFPVVSSNAFFDLMAAMARAFLLTSLMFFFLIVVEIVDIACIFLQITD